MIRWHRLFAILSAVLLAYVLLTGTGIQLADMRALISDAPATDPDMLMMRQHVTGTPNYSVVSASDYSARPLPAGLDFAAAIHRAARLGRQAVPGAEMRLVELRMICTLVAGRLRMGKKDLIFDLERGTALPVADLPPPPPDGRLWSWRNWFKGFHQFRFLGHLGTALNGLAGIALSILLFTGLGHYFRLYKARRRVGRQSLFWRGGGWWRSLHRWTALVGSIVVMWIAVTGFLLSADNVGAFVNGLSHPAAAGPDPFSGDFSAPLNDAELTGMTRVTLDSFRRTEPGIGVKVLQLRYFAGYPQGVVIAGNAETSQLVFNTRNGMRMSMTEPGYPKVDFPFGWDGHQRLKQFHRGDILGMTGRWLDTLGGLALIYLLLSGTTLYLQLWKRRRAAGKPGLTWK